MIMCLMCQGRTREEVLMLQKEHIERFGWSIVAVEGNRVQAPFAYTIGLTRFHGHPELLVTGLDESSTGSILNQLGSEVKSGRRSSTAPRRAVGRGNAAGPMAAVANHSSARRSCDDLGPIHVTS